MSQTLLGFEYGRLRTGVAVGQTLTGSASALITLKSRNNKPDWDGIDKLIKEWQPDGLVIGVPVHMDGTEQEMTKAAEKFCRQLQARYNLPDYEADERLSYAEAEQTHGNSLDNESVDRDADRQILQARLNQQAMQ